MPTYEYRCDACGATFEVFQKMSDPPLETCEDCGAALRKVLYPVAVHFKGSGFYTTDYGRSGSGRRTDKGSEGEGKGSDGADGGGGDGKPAADGKPAGDGASAGADASSGAGAKGGSDSASASGDGGRKRERQPAG